MGGSPPGSTCASTRTCAPGTDLERHALQPCKVAPRALWPRRSAIQNTTSASALCTFILSPRSRFTDRLENKEEDGRAFEGRKPSETLNSHQHSFISVRVLWLVRSDEWGLHPALALDLGGDLRTSFCERGAARAGT